VKAGRLDRRITIQREGETVDQYGTVKRAWSTVATVPAERLAQSTADFMQAFGEDTETVMAFRIRYRFGVETTDRVLFEGRAFNVVELKEIGRRVGLELRCEASR